MIERGKSHRIQKRLLKKCNSPFCDQGQVKGICGSFNTCVQCEGAGLVDAETGKALPANEIIRQLMIKLIEEKRLNEFLRKENSELWKQIPEERRVYPAKSRKD